MPTRIVIRNGPEAGRVFRVEEDMCRIGSGPASAFRVAGLDDHALTVHYRDGQYFVVNRSRHPVRLDGRKLQSNESATWDHGQVLQVNGQHAFVLDVVDDPAPAARSTAVIPSELVDDEFRQDETDPAPQPNRPRQFAIIGLALLGMFWMSAGPQQWGTEAVNAEFDHIVKALSQEVAADDVRLCFLRENLKTARALEFQQRPGEAAQKYAEIRRKCLPALGSTSPLENRAREFVARRLEELGER